jgi:hypothetical protein
LSSPPGRGSDTKSVAGAMGNLSGLSHNWYLAGPAEAGRGDEGQDVQASWAAGLALNVPSAL